MRRRTSRARRRTSRNARRTSRGKQRRVTHKSVKRLIKLARQQGWDVEFTAKGHLKFVPADPSQEIVVASGTPSDWRASKNLEAMLKRSGLRTNRRTSRGVRRNTIPPPPQWRPESARNMSRYLNWVYTTYADGTPVMFKVGSSGWAHGRSIDVKAGTKAIMGPWDEAAPFEPHVEIIPGPYTYPEGGYVNIDLREEAIEDILEPLKDNWKVRAARPLSRYQLAQSQRSWMKPNVAVGAMAVPVPDPEHNHRAFLDWLRTTFAPGTPVKIIGRKLRDKYGGTKKFGEVPKGARGVVISSPRNMGGGHEVEVEVLDARDEMGYQLPIIGERGWAYVDADDYGWEGLEPLEDNWATKRPSGRRTSRHALPRSQRAWLKANIPLSDLHVPEPDRRETSVRDYFSWLKMTFAPGTPVKIVRSDEYLRNAPAGARAEVIRVEGLGAVWVRFTDARDEVGLPIHYIIGAEGVSHAPYDQLEPLVDNWLEAFRQRATGRHRLPSSQRSWMKPNPAIDELGVEVGDILELERHPVYERPESSSYKVTRRKVKRISGNLVYLQGMRMRGAGGWFDKPLKLTGRKERGYWLHGGPPRPVRYAILSVTKKR